MRAVVLGIAERRSSGPSRRRAAAAAAPEFAPRLKILLAEDSLRQPEAGRRRARKRGHTVDGRQQRTRGLGGARQRAVRPGADGRANARDGRLEATAAIRRARVPSGGHLPIVAMTAHAMKGDRERCLAAGMDGYLVKPVRAREIYDKIESLFAGRGNRTRFRGECRRVCRDCRADAGGRSAARIATRGHRGHRLGIGHRRRGWRSSNSWARWWPPSSLRGPLCGKKPSGLGGRRRQSLRAAGHTLKGAMRTLGMELAALLAAELEEIGRSGDLASGRVSGCRLESRTDQIFSEAKSFATRPRHARTCRAPEDSELECRVFCRGQLALLEPHGAHSDRPRPPVAKRRSLGQDLIAATQRKQPNGHPALSR